MDNPKKPMGVDASLIIYKKVNTTNPVPEVFTAIADYMRPTVFVGESTTGNAESQSSYIIKFTQVGETVQVDLTFSPFPMYQQGVLRLNYPSQYKFKLNNKWYIVSAYSGEQAYSFPSEISQAAVITAASIGTNSGIAIAGGNTWVTGPLLALVYIFDVTGAAFRFTKVLQICNKLYFLNVNYGRKLEAFLWSIKSTPSNPNTGKTSMQTISKWRSKLSLKKESTEVASSLIPHTIVYLLSHILLGLRYFGKKARFGATGITYMNYLDFIHAAIFNIVLVDMVWVGSRGLLQAELSPLHATVSLIAVGLVTIDITRLIKRCADQNYFISWAERTFPSIEYSKKPEKGVDDSQDQSVDQDSSAAQNPLPSKKKSTQVIKSNPSATQQNKSEVAASPYKDGDLSYGSSDSDIEDYYKPASTENMVDKGLVISYTKTYYEMDLNRSWMRMLALGFRLTPASLQSPLCRMLSIHPWVKVLVWECAIIASQYCLTLGITILTIMELSHAVATIYAYLKYKYLKNIICLLIDVIPAVGLFIFSILCYSLLAYKSNNEVPTFYQDAGIWIVIASCVAEYLLLITYIAVAAYEYFKNRKMMKKMNVKPEKYPMIVYRRKLVPTRTPSKGARPGSAPKPTVDLGRHWAGFMNRLSDVSKTKT